MTRLLLALGILFLALSSYSQTLTELQTFRGSDTPNGTGNQDYFGREVDISGNTAIVAAPEHNDRGAVYVFELNISNQWVEVAKLTASDGVADRRFGHSIAIDGDVIVVGDPGKDLLGQGVYIFEKPITGWTNMTETIKLVSPYTFPQHGFGFSVDIKGSEILVGAPYEDFNLLLNNGRIYVYEKSGSSWSTAFIQAELTTTNVGNGDLIGISAAFGDNFIVSGALTGSNAGTVHVFERPATGGWTNATVEDIILFGSDRSTSDGFGGELATNGDLIITIGAQNGGLNNDMNFYAFERENSHWSTQSTQTEQIIANYPSYFPFSGFSGSYRILSMEIQSNLIIVGNGSSRGSTPTNSGPSGSVFIQNYGTSTLIEEVDGLDFDPSGLFGAAAAIDGSRLLIASPAETTGGVVRFFDLSHNVSISTQLCAGESITLGTQTITSPGTYQESFTSANNLDSLVTLTVTNTDLAISTAKTDNICFGDANGEINVGAAGGTGPYEYSIDGTNFSASPSFSFLTAGNYTVHIRDANGCEVNENVTITEPLQLSLDQITVTDAECFGEASGVIDVSAIGGTGAVEFSTDGTNFAPAPLNGIAAGTYDITARDQNGCEVTIAINITVNEPVATLRPSITGGSSTSYGTPLTNLMVLPNATDTEVSHFELFGLNGGNLFKSDGTTAINVGDFITVAEGQAGLVLDPNASGNANFTMRSAAADRQACVNTLADITQMVNVASTPLEIAVLDETIPYGSNPSLTLDYTGFVNGEDESIFITDPTITNSVSATTIPGTYAASVSGAVAPNYTISYTDGTITVSRATLQVIATDANMNYGDASLPTLNFTYSGFVNGEDDSVLDTTPSSINTTATANSDAGTYPITVSQDGLDDTYDFVYVDGELTINKVTLTATAEDKMINEGEALPSFTISYAGFVNSEDETELDVEPTASVTITDSNTPGVFVIIPSGGSDNNYDFSYVNGRLTIDEVLTIFDDIPEISVFPNPVLDKLNFDQTVKSIQIISLEGRVLMEAEKKASMDVSALSKGTYLLRLVNDENEEVLSTRFIKR